MLVFVLLLYVDGIVTSRRMIVLPSLRVIYIFQQLPLFLSCFPTPYYYLCLVIFLGRCVRPPSLVSSGLLPPYSEHFPQIFSLLATVVFSFVFSSHSRFFQLLLTSVTRSACRDIQSRGRALAVCGRHRGSLSRMFRGMLADARFESGSSIFLVFLFDLMTCYCGPSSPGDGQQRLNQRQIGLFQERTNMFFLLN